MTDPIEILRELLDAFTAKYPPAEAGQEAQTAWAMRQSTAEKAARSLLASPPAPAAQPAVAVLNEREAFWAWVEDRGCDTDGAWSAWQARAALSLRQPNDIDGATAWCEPISQDSATQAQAAAVMLAYGTPEQQAEALRTCGVPVTTVGSKAEAIREQARQQSERGNHTEAERLWDAAKVADGVTRDDDPRVGEPARSAAWREWKSTREFFNYNTTEQHAALNFAAGFKAGVKAARGVHPSSNDQLKGPK
jgi:hypothetical protein